jgi:asparagine synthase (glutamine-hydrolysing)
MRRLAGSFDPRGRDRSPRLPQALGDQVTNLVEQGPLRVAYTGARSPCTAPVCLLDGYLDNAEALGAAPANPIASPSEKLLGAAWRSWEWELPARMRGDFALLIWDREREEGVLARDQLGARSLYLHESDGTVLFASEVCDLLALLPSRPAPDPLGVAHWVAGSGRPGPQTMYSNVRRLAPGAMLRLSRDGVSEERYWIPRYEESTPGEQSELVASVRDAIGLAVKRRLSPMQRTGVLMSGGLDSSVVAALASGQAPGAVAAYSGVFPEHSAVDESDLIEQLRHSLALPGHTAEVRAGGLLASALESQRAWQLPMLAWGDFWALPLLRCAAAEGVEVMLGGDGGDELFAARSYLLADRLRGGHPMQALGLLRRLPGAAQRPPPRAMARVAGRLALLGALPYPLHDALRRGLAARGHPPWLRAQTLSAVLASEDPLAWKREHGPRWWTAAVHGLTHGVEQLGVFEAARHTATLAGLQARHPLFDLDLVELVLRTPAISSFDPRMDRPMLRASMAGLVPDAVRLRVRKARFDSLVTDSLIACDGAAIDAILSDRRAELGAFVDLTHARSALLHAKPAFSSTQYLWRLITAECWLKAQHDPGAGVRWKEPMVSTARVTLRPARIGGPTSVGGA